MLKVFLLDCLFKYFVQKDLCSRWLMLSKQKRFTLKRISRKSKNNFDIANVNDLHTRVAEDIHLEIHFASCNFYQIVLIAASATTYSNTSTTACSTFT